MKSECSKNEVPLHATRVQKREIRCGIPGLMQSCLLTRYRWEGEGEPVSLVRDPCKRWIANALSRRRCFALLPLSAEDLKILVSHWPVINLIRQNVSQWGTKIFVNWGWPDAKSGTLRFWLWIELFVLRKEVEILKIKHTDLAFPRLFLFWTKHGQMLRVTYTYCNYQWTSSSLIRTYTDINILGTYFVLSLNPVCLKVTKTGDSKKSKQFRICYDLTSFYSRQTLLGEAHSLTLL